MLNAFFSTPLGLDKEGGVDPLYGPIARRTDGPLLMKMLVPAPYKAPKKKTEKDAKKTRGGLRRRGTSDTISGGSNVRSASEEDDNEEEEDESPTGGRKKRAASIHLEAESPKRGKAPLPEESTAAANSSPAWDPRAQPLVNS